MYVIDTVPQPAANTDWTYTVPAQRLLRLFAITAACAWRDLSSYTVTLAIGDGTYTYPVATHVNIIPLTVLPSQMTWSPCAYSRELASAFQVPVFYDWIPTVVLPGGYTIASTVVNLAPVSFRHQWSNVTIWGDDLNLGPQVA